MRSHFVPLAWLFTGACAIGQTATDPNEGLRTAFDAINDRVLVSWWGHTQRAYFVQFTPDLSSSWSYTDALDRGTNSVIEYSFERSGLDRGFWRLVTFDTTEADVHSADFDSDGLTNAQELTANTDPLKKDSDGDGMDDGWEVAHAFNPLNSGDGQAGQDADGDGIDNRDEFTRGLNPRKADAPEVGLQVFFTTGVSY